MCHTSKEDAKKPSVRLFGKLNWEDDNDAKKMIIATFPVPTEKEDLLDLIMAIHPQVFENDGDIMKYSKFYMKYCECIEKAKVSTEKTKNWLTILTNSKERER